MPDVFLSYSREDQPIARRYADALEREGFSVWWDQALSAGQAFDRITEKALEDARTVVVLWSKHSVDSNWVRAEATQAHASQKLVPVMIEACKRPIMFELTQTADLVGWSGATTDPRWRTLVDGLKGSLPDVTSVAAANMRVTSPSRRALFGWIAVALLSAALGGSMWWWLRDQQSQAPTASAQAAIAVLPFDDLSPEKDQAYLADGIAEEILNSLARVPGLLVFARNSSFEFRTRGESLKEFGKTLGATHLLEGSLRKSGEQLRVTAQLIDARTEAHLWSRTYDRPLQDVFKVQEEIADLVAQTLEVSLGVGSAASVPGSTRNVEAWDAFLAGNRHMAVLAGAPEDRQRAIDEFTRAVRIDPSFARAWAQLALAYSYASLTMHDPPGQTWQALISEADAQARRLAPDAFYVRQGDMRRALQQGNWKDVDRLYTEISKLAIAQGMQGTADVDRARFLWLVGRFKEAIALMEREKIRNPLDSEVAYNLGSLHTHDGNLAAAMAEFDRGAALGGPDLAAMLSAALSAAIAGRDRTEIVRRLDQYSALIGSTTLQGAMRPVLDDRERGLAELRRIAAASESPAQLLSIAIWSVYFGDPQFALSIVGPQVRPGGVIQILRLWTAGLADMRRLPEFKQLVRDLGLVDYWRESGWGQPCQPIPGGDDFRCH